MCHCVIFCCFSSVELRSSLPVHYCAISADRFQWRWKKEKKKIPIALLNTRKKKRRREKRNNNQAVVCPRCSTNRSAIRFKGNTRPPSGLAQRRRRRSKKCSNKNNDHRMYKESKYTVGRERGEMQLMILISHFRSPYAISHQTKPNHTR